jgi:hypothetical protein
MTRTRALALAGAVVVTAGWYAFRPERAFIDRTVSETAPAGGASAATLATGRFHPVAHDATGTATVLRLPDGRRVLRLSEFETSDGPDLQLYLVAAADASDAATVQRAGFVALGALKGNKGDQNYELPPDVDLARHRAVTVWCRRFAVNFATAPLGAP